MVALISESGVTKSSSGLPKVLKTPGNDRLLRLYIWCWVIGYRSLYSVY